MADVAPPLPPRPGLAARLTASVADSPRLALGAICVLAALVVGLYVYYHGLLFLGPYAGRPAKAKPARAAAGRPGGGGEAEATDPETDRLVDAIDAA